MTIVWTKKREAKGVWINRGERRKKHERKNEEEERMIFSFVAFNGSCAVCDIALRGKKNSCWIDGRSGCW
jgi:hypothetical protein